jgi:hypothetical protein
LRQLGIGPTAANAVVIRLPMNVIEAIDSVKQALTSRSG